MGSQNRRLEQWKRTKSQKSIMFKRTVFTQAGVFLRGSLSAADGRLCRPSCLTTQSYMATGRTRSTWTYGRGKPVGVISQQVSSRSRRVVKVKTGRINDRVLLRLLDDDGLTQAEAAKRLGVSRQAVHIRLNELRPRTTKAVMAGKMAEIVEHKIDTLGQLSKVNRHANDMLDLLIKWMSGDPEALRVLESQVRRIVHGEGDQTEEVVQVKMKDPRELALRCMGEIREQLELQMKIFETLYSLRAAEEFQTEVLETISEVAPDVRSRIIARLNERRSLRTVIRWN
ncbi:MAG: DUF134 domain-containing protein [Deltaproteobacteria bacterium]|nr:DUF134 domain-containing protein [Deltaproteobacteria bacterium]